MPNIRLQDDTYKRLESLQSPGQSFDGVLQELLDTSAETELRELKNR